MAVFLGYYDVLGYRAFEKYDPNFRVNFNGYKNYQSILTKTLSGYYFHEYRDNYYNLDTFFVLSPHDNSISKFEFKNFCSILAIRQATSLVNHNYTVRGFVVDDKKISFAGNKSNFNYPAKDSPESNLYNILEKKSRFARIVIYDYFDKSYGLNPHDFTKSNLIRKIRTKHGKYYLNPFYVFYSPLEFVETGTKGAIDSKKTIDFSTLADDYYHKLFYSVEYQYNFARNNKKEQKEGFKKAKWLANEFDRELRHSNLEYLPIRLRNDMKYIRLPNDSEYSFYKDAINFIAYLLDQLIEEPINEKIIFNQLKRKYGKKAFSLKILNRIFKKDYRYVPLEIYYIGYCLLKENDLLEKYLSKFDQIYTEILKATTELNSSFYGRLLEKKRNDLIENNNLELEKSHYYNIRK